MHHQGQLALLAGISIDRLARLVKDPLGSTPDADLRGELRRRRRRRLRPVRRLAKRVRGRLGRAPEATVERVGPAPDPAEQIAAAAARQLRDLRLLRRLVPDAATVVFALQPLAPAAGKALSPEEEELFAILDLLHPGRWPQLKRRLETHWDGYAAQLEEGCRELGVPFVDLARAPYEGWCFVDRVHMTDHGHYSAAALLEEVLSVGVA